MKTKYPSLIIVLLLLLTPCLATETIDDVETSEYYVITNMHTLSGGATVQLGYFKFNDISQFEEITLMVFHGKYAYVGASPGTGGSFTMSSGATTIATGYWSIIGLSATDFTLHVQFDTFDRGALTGAQVLTVSGFPAISQGLDPIWPNLPYSSGLVDSNDVGFYWSASNSILFFEQVDIYHKYLGKAKVYSNTTSGFTSSWIQRAGFDGKSYTSNVSFTRGDGQLMANSNAATNTTPYFMVNENTTLSIVFPNGYSWSKIYYESGNYTPLTPTITPTATPTPDISTEICGYWSFAVNTSNVVRMGYVTGTLTESDPDNKHKKIDWFVVLPSGQEITKYSYVYDDGLFGLGAGWVKIDFVAGTTTASSEAEAKVNSLQYVMAGNNQHMRVKIYEDKSLIPLAYHDYNLFCTLDQTVHVSETTQGLSVWNINAYDQLTNNLISGITIHLYDYLSGEWQNKTTLIGGSYQFNVVPGNKYRIYIDESYWNTYDEDYTIPSPVPSQPYPVYLIRPLESVPGASWVMFYVRDGSTLNLMGGVSIALSDGQIQSTSKSGFAKFNVSDSTLYYWSASKTGYTGQSGTFNISSDTLLPDVYLYPAAVVTTPTTVPYWTQTPTPLPTYANGTVIPGYTYAPTVTATLNVIERGAKLTESTDVWYRNAPFLSNLLFLCVIIGIMGLMTKSIGGGRGGRRRN